MAQFKVQTEQIDSSASKLTSGAAAMESQATDMRNQIQALAAEWEGSGSVAFQELYAQFNKAATDLNTSLLGIADMLKKAGVLYEASENQVSAAFKF